MSNVQMKQASQIEIVSAYVLSDLSVAEEAAMSGGARLSVRESIGTAVPGASSSVSFRGSVSGRFVSTRYSLNSGVRSGGASAGKRSRFSGSIFDLF